MKEKVSKKYWEEHHDFYITEPWTIDWERANMQPLDFKQDIDGSIQNLSQDT